MIRIEKNPSGRQLAVFGGFWVVFFCIFGGVACWKGSYGSAGIFWVIGTAIPAAGLVWPKALKIVFLLASYLSFPIGFFASYLILFVIYYMVLTPIGFVLRLKGYDPLHLRFDRKAKTYWTYREQVESIERYFRQF
jgi:hypothetical protein